MNSSELHEAFRSDIGVSSPVVLSDDEVWRYMNDAYRNFVRLTGGIPDFTSAATAVPVVATVATAALDKSILKIVRATRLSDGGSVTLINATDLGTLFAQDDYGRFMQLNSEGQPGEVKYMMIGAQQNLAKLVQVPMVNDTINLVIYRLPLANITKDGQELTDVAEQHHINLLDWMKKLAHSKSDSEIFDSKRAQAFGVSFMAYCAAATAEANRYKHKTRVVSYGGI